MNDEHDQTPLDLGEIYADRAPPPELEDRIAAEYMQFIAEKWGAPAYTSQESRSDRRGPGQRFGGTERLLQLAAAVVFFLAGFGVARLLPLEGSEPLSSASVEGDEPRFMLLLWEGPGFGVGVSPGQLVDEYSAWARTTAGRGIAISGHELSADRELVAPAGQTSSPQNGHSRVGGYFVVAAPDALAARRLAEEHPHIGHGGWIEVAEMR